MEIIEFIEARIAEDEAVAERLRGGSEGDPWGWQPNRLEACEKRRVDYPPERVLRECRAKRRIVENHERHRPGESGYGASRHAVRLIASIWSDHPDFDPSWI